MRARRGASPARFAVPWARTTGVVRHVEAAASETTVWSAPVPVRNVQILPGRAQAATSVALGTRRGGGRLR